MIEASEGLVFLKFRSYILIKENSNFFFFNKKYDTHNYDFLVIYLLVIYIY